MSKRIAVLAALAIVAFLLIITLSACDFGKYTVPTTTVNAGGGSGMPHGPAVVVVANNQTAAVTR